MEIRESGLWWMVKNPYQLDTNHTILLARDFKNGGVSEEGFTREEVKQIVPQVEKMFRRCFYKRSYGYTLVTVNGEQFYVCVDESSVRIPQGSNMKGIRTSNDNEIPTFERGLKD
ncbi:MAG: hypothetical protein WC533_04835 [Candidatus Pacearchaeota archaeon]